MGVQASIEVLGLFYAKQISFSVGGFAAVMLLPCAYLHAND